jgi:NAD(P)-dependent dehydrogenase (short-subunit alcohol dehydrogenase family)
MVQAYAQSKLADSVFAVELQRRLTAVGSPIICTGAHPGYAVTNLQRSGPGEPGQVTRFLESILKSVLSHDAAQGALPTLYAAVAPGAVPGGYYGPDGLFQLIGSPVTVPIPKAAQDAEIGKRLWQQSERLTKIAFDLDPVSAQSAAPGN